MHGLAVSAMCATILCSPQASARCAFLRAAGMPLAVCANYPGGGFGLSAGGQAAILSRRAKDGAAHILSVGFDAGEYRGPFVAESPFDLLLSRDAAADGDLITAEFCGPRPVPVRIDASDSMASCGERLPVVLLRSPDTTVAAKALPDEGE